jgi:hypothetical protein
VFRSYYIFASRCIFASGPHWFSSKELFIKSSNGVGKEKKLYVKKWYSLRPELDGPPAAQPIKQKFCENPLPGTFLLARGP